MMVFWASATLVLVLALVLLFRPFWRRASSTEGVTRQQINAAIYRDQLQRLEKDKSDGTLSEADYVTACAELERRVLEDTAQPESATFPRMPKKTVWGIATLLPLAAIGLYLGVGNMAALNPEQIERPAKAAPTLEDLERMVAGLAKRLENEPDNLEGWAMLARSYKMLGQNDKAEAAFEHAAPLVEKDSQLLTMYADTLAQNADGNLAGKPTALLEKALKLDPEGPMTLWLYGTAAAQKKDFATAIRIWEHLLQKLEPQSEDWNMLKSSIDAARKAAAGAGN